MKLENDQWTWKATDLSDFSGCRHKTVLERELERSKVVAEQVIRELAAAPESRSMGAVMGALRERYAGRFDGRAASDIVRRVLAEPASA